jgi:hypothetical protein
MNDVFYYTKYLGRYFTEKEIYELLNLFSISEEPKISKGDTTGHVSSMKNGIELTFRDEKYLKNKNNTYPEGAAVLSNIRFVGHGTNEFSKYSGKLYETISFESSKKTDLIKAFGYPSDPKYKKNGKLEVGEDDSLMRWDKDGYCFFADFDGANKLIEFAIQLPIA